LPGIGAGKAHDVVLAVYHEVNRRIRFDDAASAPVYAVVKQSRMRLRRRRVRRCIEWPQPEDGRAAIVAAVQDAMLLVEHAEQIRVARHPFRWP